MPPAASSSAAPSSPVEVARPLDVLIELGEAEEVTAEAAPPPAEQLGLRLRLGLLAWDGRGDPKHALRLVEDESEHAVAEMLRLQLAMDLEDRAALTRLTKVAQAAGDVAEQLALGDLWLLKGHDPAQAAAVYRTTGREGRQKLAVSLGLAGRWQELFELWSTSTEPDELAAAAHVAQDRLGDVVVARRLLERVRASSPDESRLPYLIERLLELGIDRAAMLRTKLERLQQASQAAAERAATQYQLAEALSATAGGLAVEMLIPLCDEESGFGTLLALRARARLQAQRGDWADAARAWSELAQRIGEPFFAGAAARRAAELWDARGGDAAAAERLYAQLYAEQPGNLAVMHALTRLRLERRDLLGAVEIVTGHSRSPSSPPPKAIEVVRLTRAAEAAGDPRVIERWQELLDRPAGAGGAEEEGGPKMRTRVERAALEGLARCHRRRGALGELAGIYRRLAVSLASSEGAPYVFAAGVLLLDQGQIDEADALLAAAVREDPGDLLAHVARALCHRQAGRATEYLTSLLSALGLATTDRGRARLLREIARVSVDDLGDRHAAEVYYVRALEIVPDDPGTLHAYARLCDRLEQWTRAVDLRERAASLASGAQAAAMLSEVGDLYARQLGDEEQARQAYDRARHADPRSRQALAALAALHRSHKRHAELLEVLEQLLAVAQKPEDRLPLLLELAQVAENEPGRLEQARLAYRAALGIDPGHLLALSGFERLCRREGRWAELVEVLEHAPQTKTFVRAQAALAEALEHLGAWDRLAGALEQQVLLLEGGDKQEMARVARRLAHLYEKQLTHQDAAARAWHRVDDADPKDLEAPRALQRIYQARGRFADLAAAIERELTRLQAIREDAEESNTADEQRLLELWLRLGDIRHRHLSRPEQAAEAYERALEIDAMHAQALAALAELYQTLRRTADLERVLDLRAGVITDPRQRAVVLLQKGELLERGGNPAGALVAYQEAFRHDPTHRTVFTSLERVAYRRENWQAAMALYDQAIHLVEVQKLRAYRLSDLYLRRGQVLMQYLDQPAEAAASYARVIDLDPEAEQAQAALERLFSTQGDWEALVRIYRRRAELVRDDTKRVEILRRAARVANIKMRDAQQAADLYSRIHAVDPADTEALDALERYYERTRDGAKLVEVLRTRIVLTTSGDETIKLYLRIGQLYEEGLREPELAVEAYRKILDIAPSERNALDALARLYEATERWTELVEVTRRQIRIVTDGPQKGLLLFKCGSVTESKFGKDDEAIRYYGEALRASPACLPAVHGLRDLYMRREDWPRVIETLRREAKLWAEEKERAGVYAHIGQIYLEKLRDEDRAAEYFEAALGADQECLPANRALFELYFARRDYQRALPLGLILTQKVMREGDPLARSEFYRKRAIVAIETGDPQAAAESLVVGLEIRPDNVEALDLLIELCRSHPECYDFPTTFRLLEKVYRERTLERALARVMVGLGSLRELEYDIAQAEKFYLEALKLAPFDYPVAAPLVDLHCRLLRFDIAASVLEHLLEHSEDIPTRSQARLLVARIYSEGAMDPRRAARALEALLAEEPGHRQAHFLLAQELYLLGRYAEAQKVCERLIELSAVPGNTAPPEELARYYDYLGRIAEALGDGAAAQRSYRRAIDLHPGFPPPVLSLARRALVLGERELAGNLLSEGQANATEQGEETLREFNRGLARLHASYGDRRRAIELYHEVLRTGAGDPPGESLPGVGPPKLASLRSPFDDMPFSGATAMPSVPTRALSSARMAALGPEAVGATERPTLNEDRIALAELYMREPDGLARARAELMLVLSRDVRVPSAYRLLAQVHLRAGESERAARVLTILHLLGYADPEDPPPSKRLLGPPARGVLTDELRRRYLLPGPATSLYTEALGVLREVLESTFPPPPVGPLEPADDALRGCLGELGRLFGLTVEVALGERVPGGMMALDLPRPMVIVDPTLAEGLDDAERRFLLGRALAALRDGYALPLRLHPGERAELGRILDQALLPEGIRTQTIQEFIDRLPRRAARALDRLVANATGMASVPLNLWLAALGVGCDRAGLVACDDIAAAAHVLARLGGEDLAVSAEGAVALGQLPGGEDLVRFFLSDAYHELRLGLGAR
ncbi:MAG TPA: tetratricopeptide repeat protein [Polyangia bacterium]|nr:tetratricopeptide repeat protein [Polyangia bacterium]